MATSESNTFMKYFFFIFVFIIAFCLITIRKIEIFGLILFFVVNFIFCAFMGKNLTDGSISYKEDMERNIKYGILLVSLVFSFVSSIMMMMTIVTLQGKFSQYHTNIQWSQTDRQNLDNAKTLFIAVTTFIGIIALYVYNNANDVRKFTYSIFDAILNNSGSDWLRVIFPIVIIALGTALYRRLEMDPLIVKKIPKKITCDPKTNGQLQDFKDAFIKTYWFLFAFVIVVLIKPFIEANFDIQRSVISTGMFAGFTPGDRTYIFGQNPAINLISLLTLGLSYAFGLNDYLKQQSEKENGWGLAKQVAYILASFILGVLLIFSIITCIVWLLVHFGIGSWSSLTRPSIIAAITITLLIGVGLFTASTRKSIIPILLTPIIRWDSLYSILKSSFGLLGLVFALFTIKHFSNIPSDNACLFRDAHIRQLYIAFIVFLIIFYSFNTLSASTITTFVTNIMRYLVPPSLLGMSSYLIFISNNFMKLAPKIIVQ